MPKRSSTVTVPFPPFPHQVTVRWGDVEGAYVAHVAALDAGAHGRTPEEAVRLAIAAAMDLIEHGTEAKPERSAAAAALGRAGGLKGGKARAASLSKQDRSEIAKKAAAARWGKA